MYNCKKRGKHFKWSH